MKELIVLAASRRFGRRSPMKITRRFAVASLLVFAVAVVLGAPAPASAGKVKGTQARGTQVTLYPAADSPSPNATGTVALYPGSAAPVIDAVVVSVSKLAPNASYYMPVTVHEDVWQFFPYYVDEGYWVWVRSYEYDYNVPIQTDAHANGQGGLLGSGQYGNFYYEDQITVTYQVYDASGTLVLTSNR